jgi:ribosome maturation factor RimP
MGSTTAHFFLLVPDDERADGDRSGGKLRGAYKMQEAMSAASGAAMARGTALRELVERTLAGLGYELVELERAGGGLLRVTLDVAPDAAAVAAGDAAVSAADSAADSAAVSAADSAADSGAAHERHVGIEDCERVSRHLSHLFAVEDVDYERLEVSSPGMDRPLRGARDFERFAGEMAKVQLFSAVDGRRRLRGRLLGLVAAPDDAAAAPRVRMTLVPEAPPAPARGVRRGKAKAPAPLETIEFALADVEKARLAPEWEFDRQALGRAAAPRGK